VRCIIHHQPLLPDDELSIWKLTSRGTCSDAFQKREKASEDYAIRQREKEKLLELKKRLADSQDHIKKLEQDM
jgi:hypothetical protein